MRIRQLNEGSKQIIVDVPLTTASGKTRVKERDNIFGYGLSFKSKENQFNQKNYVEWQIGYDAVIENFKEKSCQSYINTAIKNVSFIFDKNNSFIILEMIKVFGILSTSHKFDILAILKTIIKTNAI